jgi:catechol 2,3-dioxygenase-like lactoylglutathione lyase family enzyme
VDFRLELVLIPVADVERAKAFYTDNVGFNLDVDSEPAPGFRIVQMTPPGSACSITIGTGLDLVGVDLAEPGSIRGLHLVVSDIEAARTELVERDVQVSEITHFEAGHRMPGPDPQRSDYGSYADFSDPDGNTWVLQEVGHQRRS